MMKRQAQPGPHPPPPLVVFPSALASWFAWSSWGLLWHDGHVAVRGVGITRVARGGRGEGERGFISASILNIWGGGVVGDGDRRVNWQWLHLGASRVSVRRDGSLHLPLVGWVDAWGLNPAGAVSSPHLWRGIWGDVWAGAIALGHRADTMSCPPSAKSTSKF